MNKRSCVIFRVLLNRYQSHDTQAFLSFFSKEEIEKITSLQISSTDMSPILGQPGTVMSRIHYSWLQPLIASFPEVLREVMIASLTPEQIVGFQRSSLPKVSSCTKNFLLSRLYNLLEMDKHLPIEYLPQTELTSLVYLKKQDLMNLIDFLGLHDLASEVRKIVDRNQLMNVYACLNDKQTQYLKMCLNQKEQLTVQKLGINFDQQNCSLLMQMVHKRGIVRLSRAFFGEPEDLLWHMAHILDSGRGNILLKEHQSRVRFKITDVLKEQVITTLNFLKT